MVKQTEKITKALREGLLHYIQPEKKKAAKRPAKKAAKRSAKKK